jgi:GMP synthase-like glutamine amidotransferase
MKRVHYVQHVPFETPAYICELAQACGDTVTGSLLFEKVEFPSLSEFDSLVIMGGPMGVYQEKEYGWLAEEKSFIEKAIAGGKSVLGICLGAQLIADVLGGRIFPGGEREIGWFPVNLTPEAGMMDLFKDVSPEFIAFHWHGDTFELPPRSRWIASSAAYKNQGFIYDNRVLALQFHLETTKESVEALVRNCKDEMTEGKWIQGEKEILEGVNRCIGAANGLMKNIYEKLFDS